MNFTWKRKNEGNDKTYEKLDRIMISFEIIQKYPQIHTRNHAFTSSDHYIISSNKENTSKKVKNKPFRFESMWMQRHGYENLIKQTWRTRYPRNHMFNLVKKTSLLKQKLKQWSRDTFGNINKQLKIVDDETKSLQKHTFQSFNQLQNDKINRLIKKWEYLLDYQQKYWAQRAKTNI